jgi:hypothetical protein
LACLAPFKPLVRLAVALLCTYAVFHVALFVWLNCPNVAQQRMDRANAATVERAAIIYAANGWPGMNPDAAEDALEDYTSIAHATPLEHLDCFCGDP